MTHDPLYLEHREKLIHLANNMIDQSEKIIQKEKLTIEELEFLKLTLKAADRAGESTFRWYRQF